ncbi:putative oxidoreductase C-terminal domain-containing protein [Lewinella sp. IMCC34183]|uniref:putative oxidoreductase C-terminal domain-containing protein n=1 Tax=Lewinella sp. IMCC34183 TaxID=2248762 RepID=UPI000E276F71|nr:putative oxidoreductase C-terminal domain-containing protein [Lewinella sp. IMCC34183]
MRLLVSLYFLTALACGRTGADTPTTPMDVPSTFTGAPGEVHLITLDPGHFHAALVQKSMYAAVDSTVHVFAPEGDDLRQHLGRIERYNSGAEPTGWTEEVYTGPDFLERMLANPPGNVVVLSGNNARKTEYIRAAIDHGLNVLADKPMVIDPAEYATLESALRTADEQGLLLYDIMTERFEITTRLQRALSQRPEVFGELLAGTEAEPAISKESVHHFSKEVSGAPLIRPAWFFDVRQQGEGMVDVATHLVDLILWETFPDQAIDTTDVELVSARRWATTLTAAEFAKVTGEEEFPDALSTDVRNGKLEVYANGEINFTVRGVHGKAAVLWNFEAPPGAADTHYSIMRGSRANLVIRQDAPQGYVATLYVEPADGFDPAALTTAVAELQEEFPDIGWREADGGYQITVPAELRKGHEAHFAQVTEQFLRYLTEGGLPEWERTNMLTKYYVTMAGYRMSR